MEQQSWRTDLPRDSRNKIVRKIMDTLQKHTPVASQEDVNALWKIAHRFEEKIFYSASDQHDYLKKISLKMLNLDTRTQNATSNTLPTGSSGTNQGPVRPLVGAGSIARGQFRQQQVGQMALFPNRRIRGPVGGPASSFSSINNVPQPSLANAGSIAQRSRQQGVQPTGGPNQGPVRPLVDSGNTIQLRSGKQVVRPSPGGMLSNGIQSTAGGPASSFSGITNVPQPTPVAPVTSNLAASNGGSLGNNTSDGQAPQNSH